MPWTPSDPIATVSEYQSFSVTIQYYEVITSGDGGGEGGGTSETIVYYNVMVSSELTALPSLTITGNGTTAVTISGYAGPVFDDKLKAMLTYDVVDQNSDKPVKYREYDTLTKEPIGIGAWTKYAQKTDNFEVVSFIPDATRTRDVYYNCIAYSTNPSNPVSTTKKYFRVQDLNWTPGMEALNAAILATRRKK